MNVAKFFFDSAQQHPDRIALQTQQEKLTYRELAHKARLYALSFESLENKKGIGIFAEKRVETFAAILGCLATGRYYVPLNPRFPMERLSYMVTATQISEAVVPKGCEKTFHSLNKKLQSLQQPGLRAIVRHPTDTHSLPLDSEPTTTAYILFTSGTTGKPKGVPIQHRHLQSYLQTQSKRYTLNPEDRCSQIFDLGFDLSVHDMFITWQAGASLQIPSDSDRLSPARFILDRQLSVWFSAPSLAYYMDQLHTLRPNVFPKLRMSLFCGEPLALSLVQKWAAAAPQSRIENLYGPTEATIAISAYRFDPATSANECINGLLPIGKIFQGHDIQIGQNDELSLSGPQVTEAYLDKDQTLKAFFKEQQKTWYRTGDKITKNKQGDLCYLGRIDAQFKLNGQRIELLEIELALRKASGTEAVAAIPYPVIDGSAKGLHAVIASQQQINTDEILLNCQPHLPRAWIPQSLWVIDKMPLSPNGKLDRKALRTLLEDFIESRKPN